MLIRAQFESSSKYKIILVYFQFFFNLIYSTSLAKCCFALLSFKSEGAQYIHGILVHYKLCYISRERQCDGNLSCSKNTTQLNPKRGRQVAGFSISGVQRANHVLGHNYSLEVLAII